MSSGQTSKSGYEYAVDYILVYFITAWGLSSKIACKYFHSNEWSGQNRELKHCKMYGKELSNNSVSDHRHLTWLHWSCSFSL